MKKTKLFLFAAITLMGFAANAQTTINVESDNVISTKQLLEVQSITFNDGDLNLNLSTGEVLTYALEAVQKVYFGTISSIDNELTLEENSTLIYPNPSSGNETLNLVFKSVNQSPVSLSIFGLDGTIRNQFVFTPNDVDLFSFQLNNIQTGMYIAVIQQGDLVKAVKLMIN
jgi:hypothetical protein